MLILISFLQFIKSPVLFKNGLTNRRLITCGDGSIDISITAWDKVCAHLDSINPGLNLQFTVLLN